MVTSKFPQEQWYSMFKTPSDLTTFFRLFSNCFHIQANLVTLLEKPVLSDMYIQQEQARTKDCINNNLTASNRNQSPVLRASNNNTTIATGAIGDFKLNEPVSHIKMNSNSGIIMAPISLRSEPNSGFDSYIPDFEIKMENLCENNLPKIAEKPKQSTMPTTPQTLSTPQLASMNPILSPLPITPPASGQSERPGYAGNKNQSLKQRINSLVIKTLADNLGKDKQNVNSAYQQQQQQQQQNTQANTANTSPTSPQNANVENNNAMFLGDTWKIRVFQQLRVIDTIRESLFVTDAILKSSKNDQVVISIDCEGINLGVKGELTLVEIGTTSGEAFIFDVLACPAIITDGGLKGLLENEKVIKVIHDCRNDSVNLFNQFQVMLRNVFDTQVSAVYWHFFVKFIIIIFVCGAINFIDITNYVRISMVVGACSITIPRAR